MPETRNISVVLTGEESTALDAAVETGGYASANEIVREALRDWHLQRDLREEDIASLRRLWKAGKASGAGQALDLNETRVKAKEQLEQALLSRSNAG